MIDYDGMQYNKLITNKYKLNDGGSNFVEYNRLTGDLGQKICQ